VVVVVVVAAASSGLVSMDGANIYELHGTQLTLYCDHHHPPSIIIITHLTRALE